MKKLLAILLFTPFAVFSQSCEWISHNDSLFAKCGTDSTWVNEWTFYLIAGKMYNGLAGQVLKKNSNNPGDYSWGAAAGGGDLLASNNLSDVSNAGTARTNLGLENVTNTSDANKPVSSAQQIALDGKQNTGNYLLNNSTSDIGTSPTASSTVTITHNLGRVPTIIRIYGYGTFTANAAATATTSSMGVWNSSGNRCVYQRYGAAITTTQAGLSSNTFAILLATGGGNFISGVIQNVTSTQFDIIFTETGTATAQPYLWEAQNP